MITFPQFDSSAMLAEGWISGGYIVYSASSDLYELFTNPKYPEANTIINVSLPVEQHLQALRLKAKTLVENV